MSNTCWVYVNLTTYMNHENNLKTKVPQTLGSGKNALFVNLLLSLVPRRIRHKDKGSYDVILKIALLIMVHLACNNSY